MRKDLVTKPKLVNGSKDDGSLAYLFKGYQDDGIREPLVDFGEPVGNEVINWGPAVGEEIID